MTNATTVTNETQLIESQECRNSYIERVEVLDKVKSLVLLADDTYTTVEMVANYYEVDIEVIKWHIKNNHEELSLDGMKILEGEELREFKYLCQSNY